MGVLLINLGTPANPDRKSVARYLREFLSDPRVIDLPRWFWLPLLNFVIVPLRSGRSARAYQKIWGEDGSPLLVNSLRLAEELQAALGPASRVELGMRYGQPTILSALRKLRDQGVEQLVIVPLYPQFSYTTTASGYDAVDAVMDELGWHPKQIRVQDYHDDADWIGAVSDSIRDFREENGSAEVLLFSLHGLPQRYVDNGDPYQAQCEAGIGRIAATLGLRPEEWQLCYQSRVGREEWLRPYTDETLIGLAESGVRYVQVVCPGFAADCIETLEEIAIQNRERFEAAGGDRLEYIPALNDSEAHVRVLASIVQSAPNQTGK